MVSEHGRRYGVTRSASVLWMAMLCMAVFFAAAGPVWACGGFFCQQVPIDQAGEQIIFRQDGDLVTAVVLIQYVGEAEDFSWVVPVPGTPEVSLGSDMVFSALEPATRPQFTLEVNGEPCPELFPPAFGGLPAPADGVAEDSDEVEIVDAFAVGPFDVVIVSSDDPQALSTWLADNDYDLTERGDELIAPYVSEGMNFVALKLRQNQGVGDIQPLIMQYRSDRPMVPIRLTAVAAEPDMGIIVWLLGQSRAVPVNYLSVEPNYTLLNWYSGPFAAYASYQGLVTNAMDEAGGQGFATDYAGTELDYFSALPSPDDLRAELDDLRQLETLGAFYARLSLSSVFPRDKVLEILRRELPLGEGQDEFIYSEADLLRQVFDEAALSAARETILTELEESVITGVEETTAVFDGAPYLTRLYTTLSPEEMSLDPEFAFNPDLPGQPLERRATLDLDCQNGQTRWTLTLGEGTGRAGEEVVRGFGSSPLFGPPPAVSQSFIARTALAADAGDFDFLRENTFDVATVGSPARIDFVDSFLQACGSGVMGAMVISLASLTFVSRCGRRK